MCNLNYSKIPQFGHLPCVNVVYNLRYSSFLCYDRNMRYLLKFFYKLVKKIEQIIRLFLWKAMIIKEWFHCTLEHSKQGNHKKRHMVKSGQGQEFKILKQIVAKKLQLKSRQSWKIWRMGWKCQSPFTMWRFWKLPLMKWKELERKKILNVCWFPNQTSCILSLSLEI